MRDRVILLLAAASLVAAGCGGSGHKAAPAAPPAARPPAPPTGVNFFTEGWSTDWSKHSVPYSQFCSGGRQRAGIPPIDHPKVVPIAKMGNALDDRAPVMVVQQGRAVRAYPLEILVWHEIVNDVLGGRPIAVTYCPLCNSALVFDRRMGRITLTFGTTGNLRNSDLVMWDRQTQSWWQQFTGEALVGTFTGRRLNALSSQTLSWGEFKRRYPAGTVLSLHTGFDRPYGENPYAGYETDPSPSSFFTGKTDASLPAKERVAAVFAGGGPPVLS